MQVSQVDVFLKHLLVRPVTVRPGPPHAFVNRVVLDWDKPFKSNISSLIRKRVSSVAIPERLQK